MAFRRSQSLNTNPFKITLKFHRANSSRPGGGSHHQQVRQTQEGTGPPPHRPSRGWRHAPQLRGLASLHDICKPTDSADPPTSLTMSGLRGNQLGGDLKQALQPRTARTARTPRSPREPGYAEPWKSAAGNSPGTFTCAGQSAPRTKGEVRANLRRIGDNATAHLPAAGPQLHPSAPDGLRAPEDFSEAIV